MNGLQLHAVIERDADLPQRADIHRLYDAGYVTVTPDFRFRVGHDLADDFRKRPRVRALRRPRHLRAARTHRPAQPGAA